VQAFSPDIVAGSVATLKLMCAANWPTPGLRRPGTEERHHEHDGVPNGLDKVSGRVLDRRRATIETI
jgi:hypothetical protein